MTDNKNTVVNIETSDNKVEEIINKTRNSDSPTSPTGSIRTYTSPLMGTSARAAKRRMDSDSGPMRIEGTDTYNQPLQHHYQNVRNILTDQQQGQSLDTDASPESRQSFNAKRDFFEQRFKTPPPTYDAPPRQQQQQQQQQGQKNIPTITNLQDRTSSSSNESPSVDRVLEQAVELQRLSNTHSPKLDSQLPFVIERTEQYQVFLDSANHEVRRTPSVSRTSIIPISKPGQATDLDQAQEQIGRTTDDHQAIQNLTRALQEHNVITINEYKRLPSQISPPTPLPTSPSALHERTNSPMKREYSVIDALLNNPLGTIDDKHNQLLAVRSNEIITNLRDPEYLNALKQSTPVSPKSNKKPAKEKKSKEKPVKEKETKEKPVKETESKEKPTKEKKVKEKPAKVKKGKDKAATTSDTVQHAVASPLVDKPESLLGQTTETITTTNISTEQTPLINPKENKKQAKENKKQMKSKTKDKSKSKDYQVIDAIIGSPVSLRLPEPYLTKYDASPTLPQLSSLPSVPSPIRKDVTITESSSPPPTSPSIEKKNLIAEKNNQTLFHLTKIVDDLRSHHLASPISLTTPNEPAVSSKPSETNGKQAVLSQRPDIISKSSETRPLSEPTKPRIVYRYMDEQGRILKISSIPPSQLRDQPAQQYSNRNTDPTHLYGRHIATDDDRRHLLPQYEQRATWQGEPKLPTTVTREDFESRDKRVPQIIEQSIPASRTVPVTVEHENPSRPSSQQHTHSTRTYHYPNQQNVKLAWLPLSYPTDPQYVPSGTAGYDTDSTISERSTNFRPYDYGSNDPHYRQPQRLLHNDYYTRTLGPNYYSSPPLFSQNGRGISPEYGGGVSRNYIEVFRGGDFRENKPSEIYSLPLTEHIRTSPIFPASTRHSRYDQYQSERFGSMSNRENIPLSPSTQQESSYYSNTLPQSRYQSNIPPSTVYTSSYHTHHYPYSQRPVQRSPNSEYSNYVRQSKSFDYRPLRTKLQREYQITPNLLVDEWDYPQNSDSMKYSTTTSTTNRSGLSSPDDVFISTRTTRGQP